MELSIAKKRNSVKKSCAHGKSSIHNCRFCVPARFCGHGRLGYRRKKNCEICSPQFFCGHGILGYKRKNACSICNPKIENKRKRNIDDSDDDLDLDYEYNTQLRKSISRKMNVDFTHPLIQYISQKDILCATICEPLQIEQPVSLKLYDSDFTDLRPVSNKFVSDYLIKKHQVPLKKRRGY